MSLALALLSVGLVLLGCVLLLVWLCYKAPELDPEDTTGYSDADLRYAEECRRDVHGRRVREALNGMGDELGGTVVKFPEREPGKVIHLRGGAGWRR